MATLSTAQTRSLFSALALASVLALPLTAAAQDSDGDGVSDQADLYPCDASVSAAAFAPAEGTHGTLLFEDRWPDQGDLDFNDVALTYNYVVRLNASGRAVSLRATLNALAVGGTLDHGLGLQLPVPSGVVSSVTRVIGDGAAAPLALSAADARATFVISEDLRELFSGASGPINSLGDEPRQTGDVIVLEVTFASPIVFSASGAPFDLFIFRSGEPSHEIHRPEFSGTAAMNGALFGTADDGSLEGRWFVDYQGLPFALVFPSVVEYPRERTDISSLWPNITDFASSGGASAPDFYTSNVILENAYRDSSDRPAPAPLSRSEAIDGSCIVDASLTFAYSGAPQTFIVPSGVTSLRLEAWGASGGRGYGGSVGGLGAYAAGTVSVSPGETLTLVVGGRGGDGNGSSTAGGGGGGGSFISRNGTPLLIAGGGGGGSYSGTAGFGAPGRSERSGGGGGYPGVVRPEGQGGYSDNGGGGGLGAGGGGWLGAGIGNNWIPSGGAAAGGAGGPAFQSYGGYGGFGGGGGSMHGGGGGGGYTGGNGGSYQVGGGGGGSLSSGSNAILTAGLRSGHGQIVLSFNGGGGSQADGGVSEGGMDAGVAPAPAPGSATFAYTGAPVQWQVPSGVSSLRVQAWGAEGGRGYGGSVGGLGAYIAGTITVTPGQTLTIVAGGRGGNGNGSSTAGGGGGGGSFVSLGSNPLIIAGGGGGGSYSGTGGFGGPGRIERTGGPGGYPAVIRANGEGGYSDNGGGGGLGSGGGGWLSAGLGNNWVTTGGAAAGGPGSPGFQSYGGFGGFGGGGGSMHGGGGGGGYTGGNGGSYQVGGGGGGSYNAGASPVMTAGARLGNGEVQLSW